MQKDDLAAFFRVGVRRLRENAFKDQLGARLLPIVGIDLKPDGQIAEFFCHLHRCDFLRSRRFGVAKIGRAEKPGRTPRESFDQSLCCVELDARNTFRRLAQVRMRECVISKVVTLGQNSLHEPRISGPILADDEESSPNAFLLQNIENLRRPLGIWTIIERQSDFTRRVASAPDHEGCRRLRVAFPDDRRIGIVRLEGPRSRRGLSRDLQKFATAYEVHVIRRRYRLKRCRWRRAVISREKIPYGRIFRP